MSATIIAFPKKPRVPEIYVCPSELDDGSWSVILAIGEEDRCLQDGIFSIYEAIGVARAAAKDHGAVLVENDGDAA